MSEMVERLKKTVATEWAISDLSPPQVTCDMKNERMARAVLAELREPTEAMIAALLRDKFLDPTGHNRDAITLDWRVMIDAALSEGHRR
jgi:hypothetical protein